MCDIPIACVLQVVCLFDIASLNEQPSNKLRLRTLCHGGKLQGSSRGITHEQSHGKRSPTGSTRVGSLSIHRISALIEHVNGLIVRASGLIMPSGPLVDGSSEMDDLTSLLRQLAADRKEDQDRRETDRELRRQGDERL